MTTGKKNSGFLPPNSEFILGVARNSDHFYDGTDAKYARKNARRWNAAASPSDCLAVTRVSIGEGTNIQKNKLLKAAFLHTEFPMYKESLSEKYFELIRI